jgi:hypothetical protein
VNTVHVREYERRRPSKPDKYRAVHNRLVEEVEFLESLRLQDELAEAIEAELERM